MRKDTAFIGDVMIDLEVEYTRHGDNAVDIEYIYIVVIHNGKKFRHNISVSAFSKLQLDYILDGCQIDIEEKGK